MSQTVSLNIVGETQVTGLTNVRQGAPNRTAPVARKLAAGAALRVEALVVGEAVQGNPHWYRIEANAFVWAGACEPFRAIPAGEAASAPTTAPDPALAHFGFDPVFAAKLSTLLHACRDQGLIFKVSQGLRTPQVQAEYYCSYDQRSPADIDAKVAWLKDQGAPWTASVLAAYRDIPRIKAWRTNALPGAGWHQWGEAADCYCYRDGVMVQSGADPCYAAYAKLAQQMGLTAGLYFSKPDAGHVQLRAAGGATDIQSWSSIDAVMKERFGDKPTLTP